MSKKMDKLKEVNESLTKRLNDLETYMFIKKIPDITIIKIKEDGREFVFEKK